MDLRQDPGMKGGSWSGAEIWGWHKYHETMENPRDIQQNWKNW